MDRASKAHRVGALRSQLPFVSQSALGAVLKLARDGELPEVSGRNEIRGARDAMCMVMTPFGTLHQKVVVAGGVEIEVCTPAAMLWHASRLAPIQRLLERALRQPGPLHVVLYADEVSPGNQLAHKQARKTWAWYWSVLEFGPAALASEVACV